MTGHTVNYALGIRDHAEAVKVIFYDVYGSNRQQDLGLIMKLCCHSTCFGVVSFYGKYPLGFIMLQQGAETADIIELCVREPLRRQGVGRSLLEQGLHLASVCGMNRVLLEVEATNTSAYELYRSSGFELIGKRPNYYRQRAKTADALVLECRLN